MPQVSLENGMVGITITCHGLEHREAERLWTYLQQEGDGAVHLTVFSENALNAVYTFSGKYITPRQFNQLCGRLCEFAGESAKPAFEGSHCTISW